MLAALQVILQQSGIALVYTVVAFCLEQQYPSIKVFELMPPLVNTEFSKPIGGEKGVHPSMVAEDLLKGLESNTFEIRRWIH